MADDRITDTPIGFEKMGVAEEFFHHEGHEEHEGQAREERF
ncbi:MAG: hypothetical protein RIS70_314 [Planctomycetota bacterium]|jgi:hypothetical protein